MRVVYVKDLFSGIIVGLDVMNNDRILVKKHTILDDNIIHTLVDELDSNTPVWVYDKSEIKPVLCDANTSLTNNYIDYVVTSYMNLFSASVLDTNKFNCICDNLHSYLSSSHKTLYEMFVLNDSHSYTYEHSISVAMYSTLLGLFYSLSTDELYNLIIGSILHDLGKLRISDNILNKPARLLETEFSAIKRHPLYGAEIVDNMLGNKAKPVHGIVIEHHEKLDGSGYPYGKKGNEISPLSKIVTVCDIFSAITSERSYHNARSFDTGVKQLKAEALNNKVEKRIVKDLTSLIVVYREGSYVKLNNDKTYIVVKSDSLSSRPVLMDCITRNILDLNLHSEFVIVNAV